MLFRSSYKFQEVSFRRHDPQEKLKEHLQQVRFQWSYSQIVARQVRNSINCTSNHLKNYQREVWDLMNKFEAFNIKSIPRTLNHEADMLANAASNLFPSDDFSHEKFSVELIYRPSVPDNITNWRVFKMMNKL